MSRPLPRHGEELVAQVHREAVVPVLGRHRLDRVALVVGRATFVMPAVAVRSSGSTTAIVYD